MDEILASDVRFHPPLSWQPGLDARPVGRVLVADDDPDIAGFLADVLDDEGFVVRTVTDGAEALAEVAREPVDVVVADVMMPRLGGVTLVEELRERGDPTPVVLMSAVYDCVDIPGIRFVPKPFDLDYMVAMIRRALAETAGTKPPTE